MGFLILFVHWISQETLHTLAPVFQDVGSSGLVTLQTSSPAIRVRPKSSGYRSRHARFIRFERGGDLRGLEKAREPVEMSDKELVRSYFTVLMSSYKKHFYVFFQFFSVLTSRLWSFLFK